MANKYTFDIDAACRYAAAHAHASSQHLCATYVKNAMQAGGLPYIGGFNGSDMDKYCIKYGFQQVGLELDSRKKNPIGAKKGDIMSIHHRSSNGKDYGHTCIFDGYKWISDFKQGNCIPYSPGTWWDVTFWRWTDNPIYSGYDPNIPIISSDGYQGRSASGGDQRQITIQGGGKGNIFENADENAFTIASLKMDTKINDNNKTHTRIYSTNDATIVLDELALPMKPTNNTSTNQPDNIPTTETQNNETVQS